VSAGRGPTVALRRLRGDADLVAATVTLCSPVSGRVPLELALRNIGPATVTISNPYEGASYHLISASGAPVEVPAPTSRAKLHTVADPAAKLTYLDLAGATVDGRATTPEEFIAASSFELPRGGEVVLSMAVTSSLDPADRITRLDRVPAGEYQLVVMLRVIVTSTGKRHPLRLRTAQDLTVVAA
jgi:hypothetical protein